MIIRVFHSTTGAQYCNCFTDLTEAQKFASRVNGTIQIN